MELFLLTKIALAIGSVAYAIYTMYFMVQRRFQNEESIEILSKSLRTKGWAYLLLGTIVAIHIIFQAPILVSLFTVVLYSVQFSLIQKK